MHKLISAAGALLVIAGVTILGIVGYSYVHSAAAPTPAWSASEKQAGQQIAQRVSIPKRLSGQTLAPGNDPALRIVIPAIDLDAPVVQTPPINGVWDVADWAVGHLSTTPNPGAPGNAAYSAHDDIKGEVFKRLGELKPGDTIELYTRNAEYTYVVSNQQTVDPSDIAVLNPTKNSTVTLISCAPYWVDTERLIVQAVFKSVRSV